MKDHYHVQGVHDVTDLASKQDSTDTTALGAPANGTPADGNATQTPVDGNPPYEWAHAEPEPKKRHLGWWIGGASALVVGGLVVASLVLVAPGTAVAGVNVGFMTQGGAQDAVNSRLAQTTLVLQTADGEASVTGADLNASVDGAALAEDAFATHPLWNVGSWFADPAAADVEIDPVAAEAALRAAVPEMFQDPVNATIAFDDASTSYAVTAGEDGAGLDLTAVQTALQQAFNEGATSLQVPVEASTVAPATTTAEAETAAATLNAMLDGAGFYIGDERVVPVERETLASWLTVGTDETGALAVDADAAAIQSVVDTLPEAVSRDAVDATVVVNNSGDVLQTSTEGVSGRALDSTDGIADAYAAQLSGGDSAYPLEVTETEFQTTSLERLLEVDLSEQRLYVKENGNVVDSWLISSGSEFPTNTGNYRIGWKTTEQTMRGSNADGTTYETPNVKWAMYFNGDQAFHGVYWHNNFGTPMSHGCVGMPEWRAAWLYDWSPQGVDVWVHD